jgi:hypothetical protein
MKEICWSHLGRAYSNVVVNNGFQQSFEGLLMTGLSKRKRKNNRYWRY